MKEPNLKAGVPKTLSYVAKHWLVLFAQDADTAITSHQDLRWCSSVDLNSILVAG